MADVTLAYLGPIVYTVSNAKHSESDNRAAGFIIIPVLIFH